MSADLAFWPSKQIFGVDEETHQQPSFQQALPEQMQPDFAQEMLDVYGDQVFAQAERSQGVDAFCSDDPSLAVNPSIDIPFEVLPSVNRLFSHRDVSFKGHPDMQTILDSYEEGRQMGHLDGMVFNIPCSTIGETDYFGRLKSNRMPCDPDQEAALAAALQAQEMQATNQAAGAGFAQDRTPSSLADRTPVH